ncbi:MAG: DNA-binding protein [Desulfobulbaceae bacterium DB1]|nr:MAG: DNA-binding protein [Desulfobulbaceae bacterium DB1]
MAKRHPNPRLVKTHRSYTVEEVAGLYGIHKNTVRNWVKNGLAPIDSKRPTLIQGSVLAEYLQDRRTKNKQKCKPGELFCVRCHVPRPAAEDMAEYSPVNEKTGNLIAICPVCDTLMNRRVSLAKIGQIRGNMDITFPEELQHIVDITKPSVNCDLR